MMNRRLTRGWPPFLPYPLFFTRNDLRLLVAVVPRRSIDGIDEEQVIAGSLHPVGDGLVGNRRYAVAAG
ncbi:MAG: hypothetical protein ACTSUE_14120 [Promethearchaeota archaeon]